MKNISFLLLIYLPNERRRECAHSCARSLVIGNDNDNDNGTAIQIISSKWFYTLNVNKSNRTRVETYPLTDTLVPGIELHR